MVPAAEGVEGGSRNTKATPGGRIRAATPDLKAAATPSHIRAATPGRIAAAALAASVRPDPEQHPSSERRKQRHPWAPALRRTVKRVRGPPGRAARSLRGRRPRSPGQPVPAAATRARAERCPVVRGPARRRADRSRQPAPVAGPARRRCARPGGGRPDDAQSDATGLSRTVVGRSLSSSPGGPVRRTGTRSAGRAAARGRRPSCVGTATRPSGPG